MGSTAVKVDGKWICFFEEDFNWVDWDDLNKLEQEYGVYQMELKNDGTVLTHIVINTPQTQSEDPEEWKDITDIALGYVPFGISSDGKAHSTNYNYGDASDVSDWEKLVQISASPGITAGLKNDGTVVIRSPNNSKCFEAENWSDIQYIKTTPFYILGIDTNGDFFFTDSDVINDIYGYLKNNMYPEII
ncbi:MAG: hypothetical protein IJ796_03055 [Lachnospiraceae bacterium]|nr:hypothetical protein [Lachnospiraceae bacterium]